MLNELSLLHRFLHRRVFANAGVEKNLLDTFHRFYYDSYVWNETTWMGVGIMKCPFDLFVYQEMLFELKPDVIIETGTAHGGSALFLAQLCDLLGRGRVVSVDILHRESLPRHPRLEYLTGSSVSPEIEAALKTRIAPDERVLLILDSDHSYEHVLAELNLLSRFVTPGSYCVVEDTNVNGHPVYPAFGPGPYEAASEFLKHHPEFVRDPAREKFYLTFNPGGFLKRIY